MPSYTQPPNSPIDSPSIRHAKADVLSLALIDARNHTLHLMAEFERLVPDLRFGSDLSVPRMSEVLPPVWLLGHVGWFQEVWLGRNTQRYAGFLCPPEPTLLASIDPRADECFDPRLTSRAERWTTRYPDVRSIKAYLLETLESTLELLEHAPASDDGLYFFRLALAREDQMGEQFIVMAQALGLKLPAKPPMSHVSRTPIGVPSCTWKLGAPAQGFAFDNEWPQHLVQVPEFEIDAQPVSWAQFAEFVSDGGYDNLTYWSAEGKHWLQEVSLGQGKEFGRRAPRYVEQIGGAAGSVLALRFGQMQRMAGNASAVHLTWYEASAYAHWAGRRLPTEVEWEIAAHKLENQGFSWGDVWEWTSNTFRPYPDFRPSPWVQGSTVHFLHCKTLRGASWATRERMKVPSFRSFARPQRDGGFVGFRTCSL